MVPRRNSRAEPHAFGAIIVIVRTVTVAILIASAAQASDTSVGDHPDHAASQSYNRALGVRCGHCHTEGDFANPSKPTFDFARRMEDMVAGVNTGPLSGLGGITCWSCHRGALVPARLPRASWESIAETHVADFRSGRAGLDLAMSVYAASLGVGCAHCHVSGDWSDGSRAAHATVQRMLTIFDLIPSYFDAAVRMPRTQCFMCHQGHLRVERAMP